MNTAKELAKYNARRAPAGRERRWLWSTVGWVGVEEVAGPEDCDGVGRETGGETPSDGRFCAADMVENSFDDGDRHGNFKAGALWHWDNILNILSKDAKDMNKANRSCPCFLRYKYFVTTP